MGKIKEKPTIDFIYNPDNQTKDQLIEGFVVRLKTFHKLFSEIKKSPMNSPEQHYLVEGKRGMGKTTLLLRLSYEIENDDELNSWLIPIRFNEEEYSIRRLYKLWEKIAELLEEKEENFRGLFQEMDESFDKYDSDRDYEYGIQSLLEKRLTEHHKKLILFIDNFGDIFSKFDKQEVQRLRTVLQTSTNLRIIAASSVVLESFYDTKHPFYEFFKIIRLSGLDKKATEELLLKLGDTYQQEQIKEILTNQPGRVEALRRLTGGVIRTIVLLFEIFLDKKQGSAFSDLEAILDRVTPLYKHRMDDLPAQQQEIVEAIALAWDAVNVGEISQKTRIPSKTVSAQLRQMEKNEIITKIHTNNKNHLYQLSERFFNIWYLMRHGRKGDKRKVLWLVRFLEEWCDKEELVSRVEQHISSLQKGNYDIKGAYYLSEALAAVKGLPNEVQDNLLKSTKSFLSEQRSDLANYLTESDLELLEKAKENFIGGKHNEALDLSLEMKTPEFFFIIGCFSVLQEIEETNDPNYFEQLFLLTRIEHFIYNSAINSGYSVFNSIYEKTKNTNFDLDLQLKNQFILFLEFLNSENHKAIPLAKKFFDSGNNPFSSIVYSISLIKNGSLEKAREILSSTSIENFYVLGKNIYPFYFLASLLIAKNQYTFLYSYFNSPKAKEHRLKERLKPLWYALMYYMQDEYPNEYLRMGEELKETVEEIIAQVEQMRIDYA